MTRFYRYTGLSFALIGVLHLMLGLVLHRRSFGSMLAGGLINTVRHETGHQLAFWFTFAGPIMLLVGYLMDWVVRQKKLTLPIGFGYALTSLSLLGVILLPMSGFWLVLILGTYLIVHAELQSQAITTSE